jgi:hypothetical protein
MRAVPVLAVKGDGFGVVDTKHPLACARIDTALVTVESRTGEYRKKKISVCTNESIALSFLSRPTKPRVADIDTFGNLQLGGTSAYQSY